MAATTFPLALSDFFGVIPIQSATPTLGEALEGSETGAGELLTADIGPRLWKMDINIRLGRYAEIEQVKATLDTLRYAGRSLLAHAIPLLGPQSDPLGTILGASAPKLAAVAANNREINISGLPNGYVITKGDFLSFTYGSNPVRYAFHQVARGATSSGGTASNVELTSFVRPGFAVNADIKLIKPMFKAIVVPSGTVAPKIGQQVSDGLSFSIQQTLR